MRGSRNVGFAGRALVIALAFAVGAVGLFGCSANPGEAGSSQQSGRAQAAFFGDHVIYEDEISDYTSDFRRRNGLEDDMYWASYLSANEMTAKTWREDVIRQKADRILVEQKATELGIVPDEGAVEARIASDKAAAGIDGGDEQAWADYLAAKGEDPETVRDSYEFSSIEQQVFSAEVDFTSEMRSEMCDDYIKQNLADQVVRRYSAITFDPDDREGAVACLAELEGLSGQELSDRFSALCDERNAEAAAAGKPDAAGNIGWDFLFDEWTIDPDRLLRRAALAAGEVYREPLEGTDACRVVMCEERVEFEGGKSYDELESESLRGTLADLVLTAHWTSLLGDYLSDLEAQADVQVVPMPEGLDYDVAE